MSLLFTLDSQFYLSLATYVATTTFCSFILQQKLGLWIDLTNTTRFYSEDEIKAEECKYVKINCKGHGETPNEEAINAFVRICDSFHRSNPLALIGELLCLLKTI